MHVSGDQIRLPNGKLWGVAGAGVWSAILDVKYNSPHILIPADEIEGMSPEEIGSNVLTLVKDARFCQAKEFAETILNDPGFEYLSGDKDTLLQIISTSKPYFYEFQ